MLQLSENKYIVFNENNSTVILCKGPQNEVCFKFYQNPDNLSNDYIIQNLNKPLCLKDKIKYCRYVSRFSRTFGFGTILAGRMFEPLYCIDNHKNTYIELENTILSSLPDGKYSGGRNMSNFVTTTCSPEVLEEIVSKFQELEKKHRDNEEEIEQ